MMYFVVRYKDDELASIVASDLAYKGKLLDEIKETEPTLVRVYNENKELILEGHWRDIMKDVRNLP